MRLTLLATAVVAVLVGCSGEDSGDSSSGGSAGQGTGTCSRAGNCKCASCVETCVCQTGEPTACAAACGSGVGGAGGGTSGVGGTSSVGGASGATGQGGAGGSAGIAGAGGSAGVGTGGAAGTGGSSGGAGPNLPAATGTCPNFTDGMVTFSPAGSAQRNVRLYVDPAAAAASDGPIVFYWYGTGGQPTQAVSGLGQAGIDRIKQAGGIVVAPQHINSGTFPWIGGGNVDQILTDEVIGCAKATIGFDSRHIHWLGMSAGGLYSSQLSFARSSYLASVATYSGGGGGQFQEPNNKFAAMIIHGGSGDAVFGVNFQTQSQTYRDQLTGAGHFTFVCNHGGGHRIPGDAVSSVVQFFFDHPWGTTPSPYAQGLPGGFPSYCAL